MKMTNILFENIKRAMPGFKGWLRAHGCEIQELSNEYELIRFRSAIGVGVIYTGQKGLSCNVPFVADAILLYLGGHQWEAGKIKPKKRSSSPKRKKELLLRDGDNCFYCGKPLKSDITEEHLVPVSQQGYNRLDNIVLAHAECNSRAGHMSLVDKIHFRDEVNYNIVSFEKSHNQLLTTNEEEIS